MKPLLILLLLLALTACTQPTVTPAPTATISPPSTTPSTTLTPTPVPPTATIELQVSPTPFAEYQLTYTQPHFDDQQWVDYDRLYAVDIGCLSSEKPCLGEPYLLLETWAENWTHDKPVGSILSYSWSPDGTKLALSAKGVDGPGDIFVLDMSSQIWRNLTRSPEGEYHPTWSPDGQSIAFIVRPQPPPGGNNWVSVVAMHGKVTRLFELDQDLGCLAWMPDGDELMFIFSDGNDYWQLGRANMDGSNIQQISFLEMGYDFSCDFVSPFMIFQREVSEPNSGDHHYGLFWLNLNTNEEGQITDGISSGPLLPALAPSGEWIAFLSDKDASRWMTNIYLVSFDGLQVIQVTQGGGYIRELPGWRVLPIP